MYLSFMILFMLFLNRRRNIIAFRDLKAAEDLFYLTTASRGVQSTGVSFLISKAFVDGIHARWSISLFVALSFHVIIMIGGRCLSMYACSISPLVCTLSSAPYRRVDSTIPQ